MRLANQRLFSPGFSRVRITLFLLLLPVQARYQPGRMPRASEHWSAPCRHERSGHRKTLTGARRYDTMRGNIHQSRPTPKAGLSHSHLPRRPSTGHYRLGKEVSRRLLARASKWFLNNTTTASSNSGSAAATPTWRYRRKPTAGRDTTTVQCKRAFEPRVQTAHCLGRKRSPDLSLLVPCVASSGA